MSELQSLDPEIYAGLMNIKNHPDEARSLMLDFTAPGTTVELVPNGENIPVTEENYSEYIIRMADYYLNRSIRSHCAAFRDGFTSIVDPAWIKLFNQRELDVIIQGKARKISKIRQIFWDSVNKFFKYYILGVQTEIDIDDLEENTNYSSVTDPFQVPSQQQSAEQQQSFGADHPTIVNFWKVLRKFTHAERTKFLRFVTSKSKAPLRGFKDLNPKFKISKAVGGESEFQNNACLRKYRANRLASPGKNFNIYWFRYWLFAICIDMFQFVENATIWNDWNIGNEA